MHQINTKILIYVQQAIRFIINKMKSTKSLVSCLVLLLLNSVTAVHVQSMAKAEDAYSSYDPDIHDGGHINLYE